MNNPKNFYEYLDQIPDDSSCELIKYLQKHRPEIIPGIFESQGSAFGVGLLTGMQSILTAFKVYGLPQDMDELFIP